MLGKRTERHELQNAIERLHEKHKTLEDGELATYIPELGNADPQDFGICLVISDGQLYETGQSGITFTIQSISKPFTFGMALQELGHEKVLRYVGVEPSGDAFNSIELQSGTNKPYNPMVNSGAIAVTAMLHARHGESTIDFIVDRLSTLAGRRLTIDDGVYASERRTGHRNRAIAHLLLNFGMLHAEAEAALDVYFRQCAIGVTCRDLAMMAASLSNMGRNPITGRVAFDPRAVKDM